jgi:ParB-like chromosome segregation protein Spo0J
VSNTIRLLLLPQEMQDSLSAGSISEGHTRPLLMLADKPEEQQVLFKEILLKRLTVRDSEAIARRIATDRVRKKEYMYSPDVLLMERELTEALGTRVVIETKERGGKLAIDFMNEDDLRTIFNMIAKRMEEAKAAAAPEIPSEKSSGLLSESSLHDSAGQTFPQEVTDAAAQPPIDDRSEQEKAIDENTFDPNSFSI